MPQTAVPLVHNSLHEILDLYRQGPNRECGRAFRTKLEWEMDSSLGLHKKCAVINLMNDFVDYGYGCRLYCRSRPLWSVCQQNCRGITFFFASNMQLIH